MSPTSRSAVADRATSRPTCRIIARAVGTFRTSLNQTGQAVEIVAMTMAIYLTISLVTSAVMNWYNARISLVER